MTTNTAEEIILDQNTDEVSCDGGDTALGHPVVWYSFDGQNQVQCGYCDRLFIRSVTN